MSSCRLRIRASLGLCAVLVAAAACEETTLVVVEVANVAVAPRTPSVQIGETRQLQATPRDDQGSTLTGRQVAWSSSNNSIASVDNDGTVTGVGVGTATITATIEGTPGTATVTVNPGAPLAATDPASGVGPGRATLNGTVDPNGAAVEVWFELSATSSFGTVFSTTPVPGGTAISPWSRTVVGLRASTTYYYRVVASNGVGTTRGSAASFTTAPPAPPIVTTLPATDITPTTARIHGNVDPNGGDVLVRFDVSTSSTFSSFSSSTPAPGGPEVEDWFADLSSLTPGGTYYYRIAAINVAGTALGEILSFTTPTSGAGGVAAAVSAPPAFATEAQRAQSLASPPPP